MKLTLSFFCLRTGTRRATTLPPTRTASSSSATPALPTRLRLLSVRPSLPTRRFVFFLRPLFQFHRLPRFPSSSRHHPLIILHPTFQPSSTAAPSATVTKSSSGTAPTASTSRSTLSTASSRKSSARKYGASPSSRLVGTSRRRVCSPLRLNGERAEKGEEKRGSSVFVGFTRLQVVRIVCGLRLGESERNTSRIMEAASKRQNLASIFAVNPLSSTSPQEEASQYVLQCTPDSSPIKPLLKHPPSPQRREDQQYKPTQARERDGGDAPFRDSGDPDVGEEGVGEGDEGESCARAGRGGGSGRGSGSGDESSDERRARLARFGEGERRDALGQRGKAKREGGVRRKGREMKRVKTRESRMLCENQA